MGNITEREYTKTKFEGVFFRQSAKRDPRTGENDKIYCFWYADTEGKGHWKTVGRHSKGIRPTTARTERARLLAEFEATGVNPIERDKVTVGEIVDAYLVWGRSEGKYVDQHYSQYSAHLKAKVHALPVAELTPNLLSNLKAQLLKTPTGKALELARRIDREYAEAAAKRKAERRTFQPPYLRPGDPAAAYYAHLENIRRHLTIEDYSRVDAMIALRMRSNGHSRESVAETIRACAPTIRDSQAGRNWQRYAERTADYAFGPAGDRDLERNERYRELWRKIEHSEERGQRIRMK